MLPRFLCSHLAGRVDRISIYGVVHKKTQAMSCTQYAVHIHSPLLMIMRQQPPLESFDLTCYRDCQLILSVSR